jgi:uncharacterized protein (DUF433 family)
MSHQLNRITSEPAIMEGKACVRGTRLTVALVVNLVANEMPREEILRNYPTLEEEDIRQCLHYVALLAEEHLTPFTEESRAVSM